MRGARARRHHSHVQAQAQAGAQRAQPGAFADVPAGAAAAGGRVRPVLCDRSVAHAPVRRGVAVHGGAPRHIHRRIGLHRHAGGGAPAAGRRSLPDVDGRDVQSAGVRGVHVPQGAGARRAAHPEVPGGAAGGLRLPPRVVHVVSGALPRRARGGGVVARAPAPLLAHLAHGAVLERQAHCRYWGVTQKMYAQG